MSALTTIMDAMATKIRSAVAGGGLDFQVEPRPVNTPTTPSVDILLGNPSRDNEIAAFGDVMGAHFFEVRARVNTNDSDANQDILIELADDEADMSLAAALMDDPTLNGHATSVHVEQITGHVQIPTLDSTNVHLGIIWRVLVIPARS